MGLLGLLFGGMVAGSAVKCAAEDSYFKQRYMTFPNGVRWYIDRKGTAKLMDDTIIVCPTDDVVKDIHGNVIYSKLAEQNTYARSQATTESYQPYRYAVQNNPRTRNPATTDLRTGKVVARVEDYVRKDGTHEYRKWYLKDIYTEIYPGQDLTYVIKVNPDTYDFDDPGVLITKEEYDAIQNCPALNPRYPNLRYHKSAWRSEK